MEALEAIHTRRSVRTFTPEPVPDDLLRQVLQAGAASASAGNAQPWSFVLLRSPERLSGLRSLAPGIIGQPTAVIAICLNVERAGRGSGSGVPRMAWLDIGLTMQNLLLAAHSLGLGACPIGSFHRQAVTVYLGLPPAVEPVLLLALGYPTNKPAPTGRRPLSEVCFVEEWEVPYE